MRKMKLRFILESLVAIWMVLAVVGIGALMALNSTFIYGMIVDYYELTVSTGLSRELLMVNYRELIRYLQLPWISELYLPNFEMSITGRLHFEAVK